jgi:hypothetical protein
MQPIYEFLKISKQAKEEEYYWAITQAAGRSCCGLTGAIVLEFGFEVSSLVDTCIVDHVYTQFRLGQNMSCASLSERKDCASRGVSVYKTYLIHSIFVLNYALYVIPTQISKHIEEHKHHAYFFAIYFTKQDKILC